MTVTPTTIAATTADQWWQVPAGVMSILVDAAGQGLYNATYGTGGKGGRVQCVVSVTPGNYLLIRGSGSGAGGSGSAIGGSPGGRLTLLADVGTTMASSGTDLIIVGAAGGFGVATSAADWLGGGDGGGTTGDDGPDHTGAFGNVLQGGNGGSPSAGGAGGLYVDPNPAFLVLKGADGASGTGGAGGSGTSWGGGGGGGGYYGGGGGCAGPSYDFAAGPGGGGSSWTHASRASSVTHTKGFNNGTGYVTIADPPLLTPWGFNLSFGLRGPGL